MNNNKFEFSVIVPVYNTEKYVEKCLKSIQKAMNEQCEVIIVNDGSTDNSESIIMKFINDLPEKIKDNFIYIKKENKGLADTKNVGIGKARGEFISVVDSDDYISPDFYNTARRYINAYDIIIYDLYIVFEKNKLWNYTSRACRDDKDNPLTALLNGAMSGSSCNKIIRKKFYENYKFPVGKQYEDTAVTPFILTDAKKIKYIPYPLYYYLQREKSIVSSNTLMSAFYKICKNLSDVLKERNNDFDNYKYIINEFFVDRIWEIFIQDYDENRKDFIKNITTFYDNNKDIINYIIKSDMVNKYENHYSKRQKVLLNKWFVLLSQNKNKEIKHILRKRKIVNYLRKIKISLIELIRSVLNK